MNKTPHYLGHRERLRKRLREGGSSAVADYELLEMILFRAIPRGDVKALAKTLLETFGGFAEVINTSPELLMAIDGVGRRVVDEFILIQEAVRRFSRTQIMYKHVLSCWDALINYCQMSMGHLKVEQFRILYLDAGNVLIADEVHQQGTVNYALIYPREVVMRSLNLGATALILVHNHPSGNPNPSKEDIEITSTLQECGKDIELSIHDHLIISKSDITSLKQLGVI